VCRKGRELPAEVVKTINDNYVMPVLLPIQHRVHDASAVFLQAAAQSWHALQSTAHDGRVRVDSFVDSIKSKLGATWNDKLVEPAKSLYAVVQKEFVEVVHQQPDKGKIASIFDNVKHKLGETWEQKVKANLKVQSDPPTTMPDTVKSAINHRVVEPAEAFYRYAQEGYHNLSNSANGASVTFQDFLISLRGRLGSAWNSALMEPARYLYERFSGANGNNGNNAPTSNPDEDAKSEDGDVPANTASPMPTSLHGSPQRSGSITPTEQVIYPADVAEEEEEQVNGRDVISNDNHDTVDLSVPPKKLSGKGKKKKFVKKTVTKKQTAAVE